MRSLDRVGGDVSTLSRKTLKQLHVPSTMPRSMMYNMTSRGTKGIASMFSQENLPILASTALSLLAHHGEVRQPKRPWLQASDSYRSRISIGHGFQSC